MSCTLSCTHPAAPVLHLVLRCVLQVPASSVSIGQHVLVRPGEQVPLDGVIVWGTANLSLQHITGEEQPVKLSPGKDVPAGSLSTDGLLVVRVEATAEDSTPARIARLAAEAQVSGAPWLQQELLLWLQMLPWGPLFG